MNGAALIRWSAVKPGREKTSLEVFGKAVGRFEEYSKQGRIHSHKEYFSVIGHGGGFMILDGEVEELMRILAEEENLRLNFQAEAMVDNFDIQVCAGGNDQSVQQMIGNYMGGLQEIGLM